MNFSRGRSQLRTVLARAVLLSATVCTTGACDLLYDAVFDPGAPKEADLRRLVQDHASEAELTKVLGGARYYRKGTSDWASLEAFLAREPADSLKPLRDAMRVHPTIAYHTTAWRMTWVFVDSAGVVRGYYLCAQ